MAALESTEEFWVAADAAALELLAVGLGNAVRKMVVPVFVAEAEELPEAASVAFDGVGKAVMNVVVPAGVEDAEEAGAVTVMNTVVTDAGALVEVLSSSSLQSSSPPDEVDPSEVVEVLSFESSSPSQSSSPSLDEVEVAVVEGAEEVVIEVAEAVVEVATVVPLPSTPPETPEAANRASASAGESHTRLVPGLFTRGTAKQLVLLAQVVTAHLDWTH